MENNKLNIRTISKIAFINVLLLFLISYTVSGATIQPSFYAADDFILA